MKANTFLFGFFLLFFLTAFSPISSAITQPEKPGNARILNSAQSSAGKMKQSLDAKDLILFYEEADAAKRLPLTLDFLPRKGERQKGEEYCFCYFFPL